MTAVLDPPDPPGRGAPSGALVGAAALALAFGAFTLWTATSAWAFPRFLAVLLLIVYLPGRAVLERCRIETSPLERHLLSLALGTIVASLLYWLGARLGLPLAVWLGPPAALLSAALPGGRRPPGPGRGDGALAPVALLAVLACVPMALHPAYYRNFDRLPGGEMTYSSLVDVLFHLSLSNSLTVSIPAEVPFLPGHVVRYHYGADLLVALMARGGGLDTLDLGVRFAPTFFMLLLVMACYAFSLSFLGSKGGAFLVVALVVAGEDLSWVPGVLRGTQEPWAVYFLGAPAVVPLYDLNPMLPALAFLFTGLLCLGRFLQGAGRPWLVLASLFAAALVEYKVFCGIQLLLSLGLAGAVYLVLFRTKRCAAAALASGVLTAPLLLHTSIVTGASADLTLQAWPYVPAALHRSGLGETALARGAAALWGGGPYGPADLGLFLGVSVPLYLAAVLGARLLGLPAMLRALLRPAPDGGLRLVLAAFVLAGPPLSLAFSVTPSGHDAAAQYNNAVWFLVQSKYVAWLFAVEAVRRVTASWRPAFGRAAVAALLAASLPSTVQLFAYHLSLRQTNVLGAEELGLVGYLRRNTPAGTVVLAPAPLAEGIITLTPCRSPVLTVFPIYVVSAVQLEEHRRTLESFWASWARGALDATAVRRYGASLVAVDESLQPQGPPPSSGPFRLEPAYRNARYALYAVVPPAGR